MLRHSGAELLERPQTTLPGHSSLETLDVRSSCPIVQPYCTIGSVAKTFSVSDFRKHALRLLDHLPPDGVLITKRGKPVARVTAVREKPGDWIGSMKGKFEVKGDILSTGDLWHADRD